MSIIVIAQRTGLHIRDLYREYFAETMFMLNIYKFIFIYIDSKLSPWDRYNKKKI